ncbi:MAG TPA: hypothetical protein VMX77_01605 [Candidatus Bathyarchaeia archaeon]|nr:hypothetical protein [Candidatus Bathyarchaeia archaeon]
MAKKRINFKKLLGKYWLILVFILFFFLRLPSLFEPFTYGDEGIYLTLGQAWRKGAVFYRDIHDNKPPLLYLLAGIAYNFTNFRLILFVWSLITVFLFSKLSRILFKKNNLAAFFSTLIFVIISSVRLFEGTIGNAENFMIGTTIAGFYLLLTKGFVEKKKSWQTNQIWFLAGILFSLSTLFKIPGGFDFAAVLAFSLIIFIEKGFKKWRLLISRFLSLTAGFFLPLGLTFGYYFSQNALVQYLTAAFSQNIPYLASWVPDKPQTGGLPLPLASRGLMVLVVFSLLIIIRKRTSLVAKLTLLWFSFSLFAALLSSRPYPHYLLQTTPPLALSFGLILSRSKERLIPLLLVISIAISMITFNYWHYPTLSYYQNFYRFVLRLKAKDEYFAYFGRDAQDLYQAAGYLKTRTAPQEKIFIWGNQPSIYPLSERSPIGRYSVAYHIIDFNGYQETIAALKASPPQYLIRILSEKRLFPTLEVLIDKDYLKVKTIGEIEIYRHL